MIGQAIKTFNHAEAWCLERHNPVMIITKKSHAQSKHSWKVVASMGFYALRKMMDENRLLEWHE